MERVCNGGCDFANVQIQETLHAGKTGIFQEEFPYLSSEAGSGRFGLFKTSFPSSFKNSKPYVKDPKWSVQQYPTNHPRL